MLPHDPLIEAARLSALASLKIQPDPESDLAKAVRAGTRSVHSADADKLVFDALHRAIATTLGRRVNQAEAFRLLLACGLRHQAEIFSEARRLSSPPVTDAPPT